MNDIIAYSIRGAVKASGLSRSEIYRAEQRGDLTFRKRGTRTLILAEDLRGWLESLPATRAKKP